MENVYSPFEFSSTMDRTFDSNFGYLEYIRYLNNIRLLYGRINRKAIITLRSSWKHFGLNNFGIKGYELVVNIGGNPIKLSDIDKEVLQAASDKAFSMKTWLVSDTTLNIRYGSVEHNIVVMPSKWVQSIIPFILTKTQILCDGFVTQFIPEPVGEKVPLPHWYQDMWEKHAEIMEDSYRGCLISSGRPWNKVDNEAPIVSVSQSCISVGGTRLQASTLGYVEPEIISAERRYLLRELHRLYLRGTIASPSNKLISDWDLVEVRYKNLFHPRWWNTLITTDPTKYLMEASPHLTYQKAISLL